MEVVILLIRVTLQFSCVIGVLYEAFFKFLLMYVYSRMFHAINGISPTTGQIVFIINCPSQETEVTSTPTRPIDNVVITTKGLQDRNINILDGTMVENKGKLILILTC